jgi:membrane associated rhomboid family serine protease
LGLGILVLHAYVTSKDRSVLFQFGFYPSDWTKNYGWNVWASACLHADWFHLLGNLYFFALFTSDVEADVGAGRYFLFFLFNGFLTAFGAVLLNANSGVPQVGLSSFIMSLMVYYALRFPRSKFAYLIPASHVIFLGQGSSFLMRGLRWVRMPITWVALFYVAKDFVYYWVFERELLRSVSHSGHLFGALAGWLFWVGSKKLAARESKPAILN